MALVQPLATPPPHGAVERGGDIGRQPERLAHLAHRAARAIGDDGGREAGALAAVFFVDVLDHLLAPLVLEIDVDIRRLVALAADEALEQQVDAIGIDLGDAQAKADRRIGRRAAALAQDALAASKADDVVDGEEVARIVEVGDEFELVPQCGAHLVRHAARVAKGCALPGQQPELGLRGAAAGNGLVRVLVAQLVEAETAGVGDVERVGQGLWMVAKQARHLRARFEMALGVGEQAIARLGDGAMLADARQHVLQPTPRRAVGMDIVRRHQCGAVAGAEVGQLGEAAVVVAPIEALGSEIERPAMAPAQLRERALEGVIHRFGRLGRKSDENLAVGVGEQILAADPALAFGCPALAQRQQLRQASVGGAVGGKAQHAETVLEVEPAADHEPYPGMARHEMGAHDAGQAVAVGDRDGAVAEPGRGQGQLLRVRGAAQEAEITGDLKLDVIGCRHGRVPAKCRTKVSYGVSSAALRKRWSAVMRMPSTASAQAR